jgi:hypothetical protein
MNFKLLFFLVLLVPMMTILLFSAVKTVPLSADILNPEAIHADANHLYFVDGAVVHIVSQSDFKRVKSFGKEGEGAQEFMINAWFRLRLSVYSDFLFIQSISRVSYFKKDGTFQKEQRLTSRNVNFVPLENNNGFIGSNTGQENNSLFFYLSLYDGNFQKGITFFKEKVPFLPGAAFDPLDQKEPLFYAKCGKIFVNSRDGIIHIMDATGKEEAAIKYDYGKLEATQKIKDEIIEFYKTDPRTRMGFDMFKKDVKFSDFFPPVRDYRAANEKVYVFPYIKKEGKFQVFIFDLKGKLLKTLPVEMAEKNPLEFYPFAVESNRLYQVIEDIDNESWQLRVADIK